MEFSEPEAPARNKFFANGDADKAADLQRQLKENESQRTEINGHINQLHIQLHRWQLRLLTLNERNSALKSDLASFMDR